MALNSIFIKTFNGTVNKFIKIFSILKFTFDCSHFFNMITG